MSDRFLILEDDDRLRQTLGRALRSRGHEVVEVPSLAALEGIVGAEGDAAFGCAVVDLRLTDGSGLEAVARLLARWPKVRIVVLTGYGSIATAVEAMRLGAVDYLTKPADADQILDALGPAPGTPSDGPPPPVAGGPSLQRVEWEHIQRVLRDCDGNVTRAAEQLGLHRRTLQRKLAYRPPPR